MVDYPGGTIAIVGSNNLGTGLVQAGLIDELQLILNPVVLGAATFLFAGLPERVAFSLPQVQSSTQARFF